PLKTLSFRQWATRVVAHAEAGGFDSELDHWLETAQTPVAGLPLDVPDGDNTTASARSVHVELTRAETAALFESAARVYKRPLLEVLLAALARTLCEWSGERYVRLDLEGHGRDEILAG